MKRGVTVSGAGHRMQLSLVVISTAVILLLMSDMFDHVLSGGAGQQARSVAAEESLRPPSVAAPAPTPQRLTIPKAPAAEVARAAAAESVPLKAAAAEPRDVEPMERATAQWASERGDPEWTSEMTDRVGEALAAIDVDGRVVDVACRSTLCRVRMDFADLPQAVKFAKEAGFTRQREAIELDRGPSGLSVDVFLSRAE